MMKTERNATKSISFFRNDGWKKNLQAFAAGLLLFICLLLIAKARSYNRILAQFDVTIAVMPLAGFFLGIWGSAGCLTAYMVYFVYLTIHDISGFASAFTFYGSTLVSAAVYCILPSALWYAFPLKGESRTNWPRLDTSAHVIKYYLIMLVTVGAYILINILTFDQDFTGNKLLEWAVLYIEFLDVVLIAGIPLIILACKIRYRTITINERMVLSFLIIGAAASALGAYLLYRNALYLDPAMFNDYDNLLKEGFQELTAEADNTISRYWDFWNWYFVIIGIMLNILLMLEMILMHLIEKKVTKPIVHLSGVLEKYTEPESGGLDSETVTTACGPYRSGYGEVSILTRTCVDMVSDIDDYIKNLQSVTAEKERISTELDVASKIQRDMLPNTFPPFPDRKEIGLYASMTPAREVGGDFYDFYFIDHDHLVLTIADVSGKGVPAALFMVISKTLLKNHAQTGASPSRIFTDVNHQLCQNNDSSMFCTVWLGILDLTSGKLTAASAGHEYPCVKRKGGNYELIRDRHNPPLGTFDGLQFHEYELTLMPGDCLFEYTDGVTEANDGEKKQFGEERLLKALNRGLDDQPQTRIDRVYEAMRDFVKEAEQFDDITMLCIQYLGSACSPDKD